MNGIVLRRPVATVVVLYAVALLLWQRDWLLSGEMYAEMATNYFANARSGDAAAMLFSLDSGYWPLPQRLLSDAVFFTRLNAATVPYAYMAIAVVGAGLLAGSFANRLFRPLVRCDLVRVGVALILLCSLDMETRGFINVTYLVVVFAVAVMALVCLERRPVLPWWCWSLPVLMVSKPHLLVLTPMAVVAAVLARGRARWLMVGMVAAGLVQTGVLAMSARAGQEARFNLPGLSLATKLRDAVYYGFGLAGGDAVGPWSFQPGGRRWLLAYGVVVCTVALIVWWQARGKAWAGGTWLMLGGLALGVGTGAFNALTLTSFWDPDFGPLGTFGIYRHRVTALAGGLLFVAGACEVLSTWLRSREASAARSGRVWSAALLAMWLWGTASYIYPQNIKVPAVYPLTGVGNWQIMARAIDVPGGTACVPIDPLGWSFQQRCVALTWVSPPTGAVPLGAGVTVQAPGDVPKLHLLALGVSVRPMVATTQAVRLRAVVEHAGGSSVFVGDAALRPEGVQVLLMGEDPEGVPDVRSARIESDTPVMLFQRGEGAAAVPTVAWMGR